MEKQTTKPHDRFVKELLSHHEAAVEFLMHALPQTVIDLLDMKSLQYANVSYTTEELHEYMSDVVLRIPYQNSKASAEVTVLIEHKSYKDRMTPFQMMSYVISGYREQIKNGKSSASSYLSCTIMANRNGRYHPSLIIFRIRQQRYCNTYRSSPLKC
jgi:predicted transposase/invertase (TIGR01784 family)